MREPIIKQLQEEKQCEHMLGCLYNLSEADIKCYKHILNESKIENKTLSNMLDKDKSTINRSLNRLVEAGLVDKTVESYKQGGYKHVYTAVNPQQVAEDMRVIMAEWISNSYVLIDEYEDKYGNL